jgi:chemotaxis protein MotB
MVEVFTVESNVLFKPGSAQLSPQAKASLARVAEIIKQKYPDHYVRVDGHTDNQQITRSKDAWDDNWDLSGGRAQRVLHQLIERGVKAENLGFAGFGQERPVASNSNESGKQKNRRVEIRVIPKIAGKDSK